MTNSYSKSKKKSELKAENKKYRYLQREKNLKSRRYFIDTDYIDGVYNEEGKQVIRGLSQEEKAWLNQFYKEDLCVSKKDCVLYDKDDKKTWSALYHDNYARYNDLYNIKQRTGKLSTVSTDKFDFMSNEDLETNAIRFSYLNETPEDLLEKLEDGIDDSDSGGDEG
jgi:hypothetical protein